MKITAIIFIVALLYACSFPKDVQVRSYDAVLVRIDTVQRFDGPRVWLHWQTEKFPYSEMKELPIYETVGLHKAILLRK